MNALFVNACIRESSRTKVLCDAYTQKYWPRQTVERICVNSITFGYGENGCPMKLCACKKLVCITTAGGFLRAGSSLDLYIKELCGLLCIPDILFIKADGLDIQGNDPDKTLREVIDGISCHPDGFRI